MFGSSKKASKTTQATRAEITVHDIRTKLGFRGDASKGGFKGPFTLELRVKNRKLTTEKALRTDAGVTQKARWDETLTPVKFSIVTDGKGVKTPVLCTFFVKEHYDEHKGSGKTRKVGNRELSLDLPGRVPREGTDELCELSHVLEGGQGPFALLL